MSGSVTQEERGYKHTACTKSHSGEAVATPSRAAAAKYRRMARVSNGGEELTRAEGRHSVQSRAAEVPPPLNIFASLCGVSVWETGRAPGVEDKNGAPLLEGERVRTQQQRTVAREYTMALHSLSLPGSRRRVHTVQRKAATLTPYVQSICTAVALPHSSEWCVPVVVRNILYPRPLVLAYVSLHGTAAPAHVLGGGCR